MNVKYKFEQLPTNQWMNKKHFEEKDDKENVKRKKFKAFMFLLNILCLRQKSILVLVPKTLNLNKLLHLAFFFISETTIIIWAKKLYKQQKNIIVWFYEINAKGLNSNQNLMIWKICFRDCMMFFPFFSFFFLSMFRIL